jgi:salicylate hydroxylase
MQPQEFKVAIVGGGIGGLACALSLAHHISGLQIDVYEQATQYSEIGAGVGIAVNAAKILHRLGLGKEVNAISGWRNEIHRTMRRWDNGEEIVTIGADFDEVEVKQLSVHRAELLEILVQAVKEKGIAKLHTNKRCVKVEVSSIIGFPNGPGLTIAGCWRKCHRLLRRWHTHHCRPPGWL